VRRKELLMSDSELDTNPISQSTLEDGDYLAPNGCWIEVGDAAIRIANGDEGISVTIYVNGHEMMPSVAETWITHGELRASKEDYEQEMSDAAEPDR
jgi:hypothetical protein